MQVPSSDMLFIVVARYCQSPHLVPNALPVHMAACADQNQRRFRYAMPSHVNAMCRPIPVLSFMLDFQIHSKRCLSAQVHGDGFFRDDALSDEDVD
jgi:hypothetical protein